MGYQAYNLTKKGRGEVFKNFTAKYPKVIAHHITHKFGVRENDKLPRQPRKVFVVGYAEGDGIEALVVEVDGKLRRPDGLVYHITLSLDPSKGKKPVHSNDLLKQGWEKITPFAVDVEVKYNK